MKKGDIITLNVPTIYGKASINFTIIAILPDNRYAMVAQDRVVVGIKDDKGNWKLSDAIDLLEIKILSENVAKQY